MHPVEIGIDAAKEGDAASLGDVLDGLDERPSATCRYRAIIGHWTDNLIALAHRPIMDGPAGGRRPRRRERRAEISRRHGRPRVLHADEAYPSAWAYSLHYGTLEPDPPRTLDDGTIRRYDNAHEDTKGHELHVAPNPEPKQIDFPGMAALWRQFWNEIPKLEIDIE